MKRTYQPKVKKRLNTLIVFLDGDKTKEEEKLKLYTEDQGLIFLSTPFSRKSANRLNDLGVEAFKIGSGECNNYPLISHIARFGKPIILSTGMNDLRSVSRAVEIICRANIPYALLHCTSLYPTPYKFVRLGAMEILQKQYPDAVIWGGAPSTPVLI